MEIGRLACAHPGHRLKRRAHMCAGVHTRDVMHACMYVCASMSKSIYALMIMSRCYRSERFYDEGEYKMRSGAATVHHCAANMPVGERKRVVVHRIHNRTWVENELGTLTPKHLCASADRTTSRP